MCAGGRLSGSQPPARVLKSHLWNWFHGPFGRAQRRPVPKKMPAARSAHDADSEPGAAAIASRLSQLKKSRAPYLGGGRARQSQEITHLQREWPGPTSGGHSGRATNRSAEPGRVD